MNKITYFSTKGKYLVMHKDGRTIALASKEEFDKYVEENNLEIEK